MVNLSAGTVLRGTELDRFVQVEGLVLGEGNAALTGMRAGTADNPGGGDVTVLGLANGAVIDGGAGLDVLDLRGETTGWVINQIRDPSSGGGDVRGFEVVLGALGVSNSLQGAGAVMAAAVMTS